MKSLTILAAALVAMTLTATAVHAQCTVGDITMTKTYPPGNLSRTETLISEGIITFTLPSDCPITDPPLKACVNVWDTGNPGEIRVDSAPYDPMNPKTVIRPTILSW